MTDHQFKLRNFPPVFVVSVKSARDRRQYLQNQLEYYRLKNYYYAIYDLWQEGKYSVTGKNLKDLHIGSYGPVTSHILTNKYWTENTNYDYVVVMEDDLSFEFVKHWKFTWSDFIDNVPDDWELIQLSIMREEPEELELRLRERHNRDLGCQIYLIKRNYAEEIVRRYCTSSGGFNLSIPDSDILFKKDDVWHNCSLVPYVENIIYETIGKTYSVPLFYEKLDFQTLAEGRDAKETWRSQCFNYLINLWEKTY